MIQQTQQGKGPVGGTIVVVHRDETAADEPTNEAPGRAPDRSEA